MYVSFILLIFAFSFPSSASVSSGGCPQVFEGKVKDILEDFGPETPLSSHKIIFQPTKIIKGDKKYSVVVDVLKGGPFKVQKGKKYFVELRNGKLCSLSEI